VSVTVNMRKMPDGLSIRVTETRQCGRFFIMIVTGIVAAYVLYRVPFSSPALRLFIGAVFLIGLLAGLISALRGCDVELRVTNLDFVSAGHALEGYNASTLPRADIFRLEYRDASGDIDAPQAKGLYAEHRGMGSWSRSTCVLPQVDRAQAEQIIEAIYQRFPDTGTLSSAAARESCEDPAPPGTLAAGATPPRRASATTCVNSAPKKKICAE